MKKFLILLSFLSLYGFSWEGKELNCVDLHLSGESPKDELVIKLRRNPRNNADGFVTLKTTSGQLHGGWFWLADEEQSRLSIYKTYYVGVTFSRGTTLEIAERPFNIPSLCGRGACADPVQRETRFTFTAKIISGSYENYFHCSH